MKKILAYLLTATLVLATFTSCENDVPNETTDSSVSSDNGHTHQASEIWNCDINEHWHVCDDDGTRVDVAEHTLDFYDTCEVCGCKVIDWGDEKELSIYNDKGDCIRSITYDVSGNIISEQNCEFVYDENGNLLSEKCYHDGKLDEEKTYALGEDGVYESKIIRYEEDGTRYVHEYDACGDLILWEVYDANGTLTTKSITEYAENEDGEHYEAKTTEYNYEEGEIYISEYNAYGDQTGRTITDMDGNVTRTDVFEHGYDENGDHTWIKNYTDGVLVKEYLDYTTYEEDDYSMRYPATIVEYYEDGSKLVTENGTDGNPEKETLYNADGTVESVTTYTDEE